MFDLRYHVASLTAVFIALVIGILVGVGLSGRGFVDDAERTRLNNEIEDRTRERDQARSAFGAATRRQTAMEDYAADTSRALIPGRLEGVRVALVVAGSLDDDGGTVDRAVRAAVRDAGGSVVRSRALRFPVDPEAIRDIARRTPALQRYVDPDALDDLGRALGRELVMGGRTPVWDALSDAIVEERDGGLALPVDAVVVARSVRPQRGASKDLLAGLYSGLQRSGVPAVGADAAATETPAVPAFRRAGLSTVDSVDTPAGRLALVLLLAGGGHGSYGVEDDAVDGILPPLEPLRPAP